MSSAAARVLCPVTVGRDRELEVIALALDATRAGHGGCLVVSGEPGIGKTRLAGEATNRARRLGMRVLRGRAVSSGVQPPFRPLAEAFQSVLREEGPPQGKQLDAYRPLLGWLVPEWGSRPAVGEQGAAVLEGVLRLVRALTPEPGLLLVLEDLHWADAETAASVEYLADNIGADPVLVLMTTRTGQGGAASGWLDALIGRRGATEIAVGALPPGAVEEMARRALESDALPAAVGQSLAKRAEGVPFLIEEMLSAYVAAGGTHDRGEWWLSHRVAQGLPSSYRDLVEERLAALDENGQRVVLAAAVLGRTFDWLLAATALMSRSRGSWVIRET